MRARSEHRGNAAPELGCELRQLSQHPWTCNDHDCTSGEQLRDEGQRHLLDLRHNLQYADDDANKHRQTQQWQTNQQTCPKQVSHHLQREVGVHSRLA